MIFTTLLLAVSSRVAHLSAPEDFWGGAYGEVSDERVVWDAFALGLEVDGTRLSGTFFGSRGERETVRGSLRDGEARFSLRFRGERLRFSGTVEDEWMRGTCTLGKENFTFLLLREDLPGEERLAACAGLYERERGEGLLIRRSVHLLLEDFETGYHRTLYAVGDDEFVAGELFALTEPPVLRIRFEHAESGAVEALTLTREDGTVERLRRTGEPRARQFTFANDDVTLHGTLTLPDGPGPHPAAVWVHGSGRATRANAGCWPAYFASRGVAMLAVDKRGVGESEGTYELPDGGHDNRPHMARRAGDVRAAVAALAAHESIDPARIGLCGGSQAGWVIPQACGTNVAFAITLSGGATPLSVENVYSQLAGELEADGASLSFEELDRRTRAHEPDDPSFDEHFAAMTCPALWLYGLKDRSNPSLMCVELLERIRDEHELDFTLVTFPDANHSLLQAVFGGAREAGSLGLRAPRLYGTVGDWLAARGFGD